MILNDFKHYKSQYVKGAKKISIRSTKPVIEYKTFALRIEPSFGNYDLHFNKNGRLLQSIHNETDKFQIVYAYNEDSSLTIALKFLIDSNELMELSQIEYDDHRRVLFESTQVQDKDFECKILEEKTHSYSGNMEEILMTSIVEEEGDLKVIITFDDNKRLLKKTGILFSGINTHTSKEEGWLRNFNLMGREILLVLMNIHTQRRDY
jgi:hypothetical protein